LGLKGVGALRRALCRGRRSERLIPERRRWEHSPRSARGCVGRCQLRRRWDGVRVRRRCCPRITRFCGRRWRGRWARRWRAAAPRNQCQGDQACSRYSQRFSPRHAAQVSAVLPPGEAGSRDQAGW